MGYAEKMDAVIQANISNPMALAGHLKDIAAGMDDVVSRIRALEKDVAALKAGK